METRYIPEKTKLYSIARKLTKYLFDDPEWRLNYKTFIELMDIVCRDPSAPNPHNISYGLAIDGINDVKEPLHDMGTGGSHLQLQSKQAITCSLMQLDEHNNVRNRKLLKKVLSHKNRGCRNEWITQCTTYLTNNRKEINSDEKDEEIIKQYHATNVCDWHKQ